MIDKDKYIFGGRLANYAYMNMDQTIISSLKTFENHIKGII
jgi:UDP-galactopyranose mutase